MPITNITVACPVHDSFRVKQVSGLFDVPLTEKVRQTFSVEVPELAGDWKIGLIVGPSGSGKSTIARELFGRSLYQTSDWPRGRAVIDVFPESLSIREITALLTAVGFSSPPGWVKPYEVLSNGERFRCDLALALSQGTAGDIIAFDEFTSVVDRNVARVASAAIAKGIQQGRIRRRFVAVTCHYDVTRWLEPTWVIDMASSTMTRRCLRRPAIELEIVRCTHAAWPLFARHHYLSGNLAPGCRTYMALWNGEPVTFCAVLPVVCRKGHWRFSRVVTLPDYQGIGIGMRVTEAIAEMYLRDGNRINITGSHPAVIAHCKRSPAWKTVSVSQLKTRQSRSAVPGYRGSEGRVVVSFEFCGSACNT